MTKSSPCRYSLSALPTWHERSNTANANIFGGVTNKLKRGCYLLGMVLRVALFRETGSNTHTNLGYRRVGCKNLIGFACDDPKNKFVLVLWLKSIHLWSDCFVSTGNRKSNIAYVIGSVNKIGYNKSQSAMTTQMVSVSLKRATS